MKVARGDILLHHILGVHAWAGYSTVTSAIQENRESSDDDRRAHPSVIPIKRGKWLVEGQCEKTVLVCGLSTKHFHRQRAFSKVAHTDAELIIEAIDAASAVESKPSDVAFHSRWTAGYPENYYKPIIKAAGKCWLCNEDAELWASRVERAFKASNVALSKDDAERLRSSFLDAAHIIPHSKQGPMTPDNLRPLCPTCHRVVDRLSEDQREQLLRNNSSDGMIH